MLLVLPVGPFWRHRNRGAWSIPKGELGAQEDVEAAARRKFAEELGLEPTGLLGSLGACRQRSGKWVEASEFEGEFEVARMSNNTFGMEWPPRSGQIASVPEVDRAEWLSLLHACEKIVSGQRPFPDRLEALCAENR